ncbi:MAG: CBS domain-containing protein [Candidatus Micrarchaeota archaeon]|nr:CBS domain-containing protein [Candidatus Micrarchaeota archaeon]MCX8154236.1 CBS domain-containing protein [Candidatus Micrarchaeota archaeon]
MRLVTVDTELGKVMNDIVKEIEVIVVDRQGRLIGTIDRRALNVYRNHKNVKVDRVTKTLTGISEADLEDLDKVLNALIENGDFLVIVDRDRIPKRIIRIEELVQRFEVLIPKELKIRDIMDTHLAVVRDKSSLEEVKFLMFRENLEHVIVVDQKGTPISVVTYDEVILSDFLSDRPGRKDLERDPVKNLRLKDMIIKDVILLSPDTPAQEILKTDIAVVYDRAIRGIVRRKDLLKYMLKNLRYIASNINIFGLSDSYSYGIVMNILNEFKNKIQKILRDPRITLRFKHSKVYEAKLTIHSLDHPTVIAEDIGYDPIALTKELIDKIQNRISKIKRSKRVDPVDID